MSALNERETLKFMGVFAAALRGDELAVHEALQGLDQSQASRLRNALHELSELAEQHRRVMWRAGR
jgi:hypothetical protein